MSDRPLVSVLTPVLNAATYLSDTIRSIRNQSYENIEHVFADGGSTDGTLELIREYAETHNVRWISEPDSGTSEANNRAAAMASGEFIIFVSSDDLLFPWAIEAAVDVFRARPDVDVVYGDHLDFWGDLQGAVPRLMFVPDASAGRLKYVHTVPFWSFMRRHVYPDVGGCNTDLSYHNDHEFCYRVAQQATCMKVDEFFYIFRKHPAQFSRVTRMDADASLAAVEVDVAYPSGWTARWIRRWYRAVTFAYGRMALLRFLYRTMLMDRFGRVPSEAWPWRHFLAEHRIELRPWRRLPSRLIPTSKSYAFLLDFSCTNPSSRESPFAEGWRTDNQVNRARRER